ncbi:MAG: helix-turn-helix transcriptional regulator [Micromonosporaceae bacterium]
MSTVAVTSTDSGDGTQSRGTPNGGGRTSARRSDLAAFLRSRRARISPEDVQLPAGPRRRTPGLRREEVAQLSGVGVTWYTWLEQGRPINASVQVLDAVARTLRLDWAEREHLYRLADVPAVAAPDAGQSLRPEVKTILDGLVPFPAHVINERFDLLEWNRAYAALFPSFVRAPIQRRNVLWQCFTVPGCCNQYVNRDANLPRMVALLRASYGRHVGDPAWTEFVRRLSCESAEFARMWETHDVAEPGTQIKVFRHAAFGEIRLSATSMAVLATAETRMYVYTPADDASGDILERLAAGEGADARFPCGHGAPRCAALT